MWLKSKLTANSGPSEFDRVFRIILFSTYQPRATTVLRSNSIMVRVSLPNLTRRVHHWQTCAPVSIPFSCRISSRPGKIFRSYSTVEWRSGTQYLVQRRPDVFQKYRIFPIRRIEIFLNFGNRGFIVYRLAPRRKRRIIFRIAVTIWLIHVHRYELETKMTVESYSLYVYYFFGANFLQTFVSFVIIVVRVIL